MSDTPKPNPEARSDGPSALPRIEGYRIEGVLGRGATGVVYSAVQLAVDRSVAIKLLHPELMGNRKAVRRLQREARTAAKLAHPAIISAIDMGESEGRWWYAMELVEGISLGERLEEQGSLTERQALRFFEPLVDALQYAHEAGVTHRDVKPANILIDPHGQARLVDLGLAIGEDDPALTSPGGTLGTPHYISPEQAKDPSCADTRSDIWSLGASMYHALCGRPPFTGASVAEVLSAVLYHRVPDPRKFAPELSKGMVLVLRKCLARDPAKRYTEPHQLARDLELLRERRAPDVRASSLDPLYAEGEGKSKWLLGAAGLLLIGGAIGLGIWSSRPAPERVATSAPSPRLDKLRQGYRAGSLPLAMALDAIDNLLSPSNQAPVQPSARPAVREFKLDLLQDLSRELRDFRRRLGAEFDGLLEVGQLVKARGLMGMPFDHGLATSTGFQNLVDLPVPEEGQRLRTWREEQVVRADGELTRVSGLRVKEVEDYVVRELGPRAAGLYAGRRYIDALRNLEQPWSSLIVSSGCDLTGLDRARVHKMLEARVRRHLDQGLRDAQVHWDNQDHLLVREIRVYAEELGLELATNPALDPGPMLDGFVKERLDELLVDLEQVPEAWLRRYLRAQVEMRAQLKDERGELRRTTAAAGLAQDLRYVRRLYSERSYDLAVERWENRLGTDWRASVHPEVGLLRFESERLVQFLDVANRALQDRNGQEATLYRNSIGHSGTLRVPGDARLQPFALVKGRDSRGAPNELLFQLRAPAADAADAADVVMLATRDMERVWGWAKPASAKSLLSLALFRFHEGDLKRAAELLPNPMPVPTVQAGSSESDLEARLWQALDERIQRALQQAGQERLERDKQLELEMLTIQLDSRSGSASRARIESEVERVREEYADILSTAQQFDLDTVLRVWSGNLQVASVQSAFPAASRKLHTPLGSYQPVDLRWEFNGSKAGAWQLGPFRVEGGALALSSTQELRPTVIGPGGGAILALGAPLQPERHMSLILEFMCPEDSSLKNELLISLAGYNLVFLNYSDRPRFVGGTEPLETLLQNAESASGKSVGGFEGMRYLVRGKRHVLQIDLDPRAGRLERVIIDSRKLHVENWYQTEPRTARAPTLELRSSERIEFLSVVLSAAADPE
ncbi:MAG: serine/threonine protein kinase [Planctomycetota bacterium]